VQRLARTRQYWSREARLRALIGGGLLRRVFEQQSLRELERQVPDPVLRARLTPDYAIGCKRVIVSDDYLPALTRPNVEVVASPVAEVRRALGGRRRRRRARGRRDRLRARSWYRDAQGRNLTLWPTHTVDLPAADAAVRHRRLRAAHRPARRARPRRLTAGIGADGAQRARS
jgi:cation diffusion facilitator CzcD-associated flavoprotein CzcO